MKAGLIGAKLSHSFSKTIHEQLADYSYDLIELNEDQFHEFMRKKDFDAINVTIPYKEKVIPYCDEIDEKAKSIQAVNCIKNVHGRLIATNTDFDGLKAMIEKRFDFKDRVVAILGSGGTSKTAYAVCQSLLARKIIQVARNRGVPYITYEELKNYQDIDYIIQTTSVGMSPNILDQVIDLNDFQNCKGVIDVIYNPLMTSLTYQAKQKGIPFVNGLEMLVGQAVAACEFFTGKMFKKNTVELLTNDILKEKRNIVLIGMPGCGKTTIGKKLANRIGFEFVDIDAEIVQSENRSIPEIFKEGEDAFRKIETRITEKIALKNHCVISCGGGIIKNEINMKMLALNGWIVYLKRDVNHLSIGKGRPLSTSRKALWNMYRQRDPYYRTYSNCIVNNEEDFKTSVENIKEAWNEDIGY